MKLHPNNFNQGGYAGSRFIASLAIVGLIFIGTYTLSDWGREFYRVKAGENCTQNLEMIQNAKLKYRLRFKYGDPPRYSDMMPFLGSLSFPSCPYGGEYLNSLKINQETQCPSNADKSVEPESPGIDLKKNGYHDLGPRPKRETIIGFIGKKIWESTGAMSTSEQQKRKDQLFKE